MALKQTSFSSAEFAAKKRITRREQFLAEMEQVVPWAELEAVIAPVYPTGMRGRPPIGLSRMLRVYFIQQWYSLSDEAVEDAIYDSQSVRAFVWLAVAPLDMRAGMDAALARVITVFGAAQPHHAYLFANRRANRMKVLVHDGIGIWLASRRLHQGRFAWPSGTGTGTGTTVSLSQAQLEVLSH